MIDVERRAELLARIGELDRELRRLERELETMDGAPLLAAGPFDLLLCRVDNELVGFVETEVERVVQAAELLPVADAPPWVLGLLNLRGTLLPIVSIEARVGRSQAEIASSDSYVIANVEGRRTGVLVQDTLGMRSVAGGSVQSPSHRGVMANFVVGLVPDDEGLVSILSVERLMSSVEITAE